MWSLIFCRMLRKYCLHLNVKSQLLCRGSRRRGPAIQRERSQSDRANTFSFGADTKHRSKHRDKAPHRKQRKKCGKKDSVKSTTCSLKNGRNQILMLNYLVIKKSPKQKGPICLTTASLRHVHRTLVPSPTGGKLSSKLRAKRRSTRTSQRCRQGCRRTGPHGSLDLVHNETIIQCKLMKVVAFRNIF